MVAVHPTTPREDEFPTSDKTRFQLRMNNNQNQQQEFELFLQIQKDDYESIIQRHLKFIDQVY
jgi:hypothetical protein